MHAHRDTAPIQQGAKDSRPARPGSSAQQLQRRYGNRQTQAIIQAKLNVGPVDDPLEREADRIADLATRSSDQHAPEAIGHVHGATGGAADPAVADAIARASARGGGQAVPSGVRERMEQVSGADLDGVRVHVDAEADRLNDALGSRAFTVGADVFVRPSEYRPGTARGDALLSHELTHTVQQGAAPQATHAPSAMRMVQRQGEPYASDKRKLVRIAADTLVYHATSMPSAKDIILNGIKNRMGKWAENGDENEQQDEHTHTAKKTVAGALGPGLYTYTDRVKAVNWGLLRDESGCVVLKFRVKRAMYGFQATQQEEFKVERLENTPLWTHSVAVGADADELMFLNGAADLEFVSAEAIGFTDYAGAAVIIPEQTTYGRLEALLLQAMEPPEEED